MQNFLGKLQLYLATEKKLTWDSNKKTKKLELFFTLNKKSCHFLTFSFPTLTVPAAPLPPPPPSPRIQDESRGRESNLRRDNQLINQPLTETE
jgi:hypothetical protein